jgi:hypothetical protein
MDSVSVCFQPQGITYFVEKPVHVSSNHFPTGEVVYINVVYILTIHTVSKFFVVGSAIVSAADLLVNQGTIKTT